ncbi:hypothetical protein M3650_21760 [Paenibacillus sp. MER TA 81-3]|uniref:hypothetical protein n=1 Tax=Paenibacillus sp. MER TA 81-3 TaxID=2939573 RepID=UPI00203D87F3|nr:hypothetical protein [Paenibacillus sp. MER TA 81-3]MCM3341185.1 hypothetical protein [Paenibacillus sp. MER TA 81-3]
MKKFLRTFAIASVLIMGISSNTFAAQSNSDLLGVRGGWSEDGGYFINVPTGSYNLLASSKPESHKATKEYQYAGKNVLATKVIGETEWEGVYHYTRARFESVFDGTPYADSDRQWGNDKTRAESDWYIADFAIAKTYYGNE